MFFDTVNGRNPAKKALAHQGVTMAEAATPAPVDRQARATCRCSARIPAMPLWSSHPRVFLDIADDGEAMCPYCGTRYGSKAARCKGGH